MDKKFKLLLIAGFALIAVFGAFIVFEATTNKATESALIAHNKKFVEAWGTYSYLNYKTYSTKVKPYLDESLFKEHFNDPQAEEIRAGKIITKEYSLKTTVMEIISFKKYSENYLVISKVQEVVKSRDESSKKVKILEVTYQEMDGVFKVVNIEYK